VAEKIQINIEYNTIEDRLLLRVAEQESSGGCNEYRCWLTRRFVYIFIKAIDKLIEDGLAADMQVSPDALEAMKKFQRDAALAKADFTTSYKADSEKCSTIGEEPLLVTTLKIKKKSKDRYTFSFIANENEGINITANVDLIHSLRKMLISSVKNTGWNQPVSRTGEDEVITTESPGMVS
jgi:hypothetical protein